MIPSELLGGGDGNGQIVCDGKQKGAGQWAFCTCRGGGSGVGEKDQNWGLEWVEGSSVRGEGRD